MRSDQVRAAGIIAENVVSALERLGMVIASRHNIGQRQSTA
jgi:hypothetical protein